MNTTAAFGVFSRLLQRRAAGMAGTAAAADAAQRSGALESPLSKLEASIDLSQKLKTLKAQLVQEKAESEVAIAQRERVIQQLRGQLGSARTAVTGGAIGRL